MEESEKILKENSAGYKYLLDYFHNEIAKYLDLNKSNIEEVKDKFFDLFFNEIYKNDKEGFYFEFNPKDETREQVNYTIEREVILPKLSNVKNKILDDMLAYNKPSKKEEAIQENETKRLEYKVPKYKIIEEAIEEFIEEKHNGDKNVLLEKTKRKRGNEHYILTEGDIKIKIEKKIKEKIENKYKGAIKNPKDSYIIKIIKAYRQKIKGQ